MNNTLLIPDTTLLTEIKQLLPQETSCGKTVTERNEILTYCSFSFLIGTHNESSTNIINLIKSITPQFNPDRDEIVIVDDYSTNDDTNKILEYYQTIDLPYMRICKHHLNNDFAAHKNYMVSQCTKHYIFNFDADEYMTAKQIRTICNIVRWNLAVELFWLPRVNIYSQNNQDDVIQFAQQHYMSTSKTDDGKYIKVNWPDLQGRVFKNLPHLKWKRKVHEYIVGEKTYCKLPFEEKYAIWHDKTLDIQEKQNQFYNTI